MSWTPPVGDNGSTLVAYVVTPFIGQTAQVAVRFDSTATAQTITGLTNGTTYRFSVHGINALGADTARSDRSTPVTPSDRRSPSPRGAGTPARPRGRHRAAAGASTSKDSSATGPTRPRRHRSPRPGSAPPPTRRRPAPHVCPARRRDDPLLGLQRLRAARRRDHQQLVGSGGGRGDHHRHPDHLRRLPHLRDPRRRDRALLGVQLLRPARQRRADRRIHTQDRDGDQHRRLARRRNFHACAALADGSARCWGSNNSRQLGNGTDVHSSSTPVTVTGLSTATQLAAGDIHTCARLTDRTLRCWGNGGAGQLGNGSVADRANPCGGHRHHHRRRPHRRPVPHVRRVGGRHCPLLGVQRRGPDRRRPRGGRTSGTPPR